MSCARTHAVINTRQSIAGRGDTMTKRADTLISPTFAHGFLELALSSFHAAARVPQHCCMQLLDEGKNLLLPQAGQLQEA